MATDDVPAYVSIGEALADTQVFPLPPGVKATAVWALIKTVDQDGHPNWATRATANVNRNEFLGALIGQVDHQRREAADDWYEDEDNAPDHHDDPSV